MNRTISTEKPEILFRNLPLHRLPDILQNPHKYMGYGVLKNACICRKGAICPYVTTLPLYTLICNFASIFLHLCLKNLTNFSECVRGSFVHIDTHLKYTLKYMVLYAFYGFLCGVSAHTHNFLFQSADYAFFKP